MFQQSLLRNHASLGVFFGPLFRGGARTDNYRKAWLLPLAFLATLCGVFCAARGSASKKTLFASEQDRPDVARRRTLWKKIQLRLDPRRLVFMTRHGRRPI